MPGSLQPQISAAAQGKEAVLQAASKKWGVPVYILEGVWGIETNYGQNHNTSSAGAKGNFQFMPSTNRSYHLNYPMTNTPNADQFAAQVDNAAHLLVLKKKENGGTWEGAIKGYSGGGYTLDDVKKKAASKSNAITDLPGNAVDAAKGVVSDLTDWATALGKLLDNMLDPNFWLRVLQVGGGSIILLMGLKTLTGVSALDTAGKAANVAMPVKGAASKAAGKVASHG